MEPFIFDDKSGLWYELKGDNYLPCLKLPDEDEYHFGIWGERRKRYLKQAHKPVYETMLQKGTLYAYLADVDTQAWHIQGGKFPPRLVTVVCRKRCQLREQSEAPRVENRTDRLESVRLSTNAVHSSRCGRHFQIF